MADVDLDNPTFSITATAQSEDSARNWFFGNPVRDQLRTSLDAVSGGGLVAQNQTFAQASAGAGILRTMNQAIAQAGIAIEKNKVAATWVLAILGVVVVAKAVGGKKGRR